MVAPTFTLDEEYISFFGLGTGGLATARKRHALQPIGEYELVCKFPHDYFCV